ncbi:hypothetical protein PoB_007295500 [Plakobranchus ocellatus]|uniref:Uncharacterized protein n=1 Tax=Plakobranchus ocellatus TaxID=259542 RepID=A0AAV4DQM3_9GAST|nr:hypothetical protein PoB_007295500 [Plakobranchus ocellatus]
MHMWSEDVAERGSNEVLSSLNKYFSNKALDASNLIACHNVDEAWQQVRIGRPGVQKPVQPQALYWGRREITLSKLKDLKAFCAFIPVQCREFYTSLQAVTPSPCKLRTGPTLKNTPTVSSEDEQDLSDEMFSFDSKFFAIS